MTLKYFYTLFIIVLVGINNSTFGQDWRSFANIDRYADANAMLKADSSSENRIVFMGNSITEAWPVISPEFFQNNEYIGRGISGQTTPQMLLRFRYDVIELKPKVVVLLAGTNDLAGNTGETSIEAIAANIQSMAELAVQNGIQVIISSVLPAIDFPWTPGRDPAEKIVLLNSQLRAYAAENNFIYVDYHSDLVDAKGGLKVPTYTAANDLVHPNKKGYAAMEKLVKPAIEKALSIGK
ncbi:MAG: acylhydrolase [Flavobacteriaceae bacterium]|nr:acylhydrolase [Flavobacteriaceae bacterium]